MNYSFHQPVAVIPITLGGLLRQSESVLKIIAARKDSPVVVLTRFACSKNKGAKLTVAGNPNTPSEIPGVFSGDEYVACVCAVVANPATLAEVLARTVDCPAYERFSSRKNSNVLLCGIICHMLGTLGNDDKVTIRSNSKFNVLQDFSRKFDFEQRAKHVIEKKVNSILGSTDFSENVEEPSDATEVR